MFSCTLFGFYLTVLCVFVDSARCAEELWSDSALTVKMHRSLTIFNYSEAQRPHALRDYILRHRGVSFLDVKNSLYAGWSSQDFKSDVLALLDEGMNFVVKDGFIQLRGSDEEESSDSDEEADPAVAIGADELWPDGVVKGQEDFAQIRLETERPQALHDYLLRHKGVCFVDVRNSLYAGWGVQDFKKDVLHLMHHNVRLVAKDGCIRLRNADDGVFIPSDKPVSRAMFDLLDQECTDLFWLRFHLYVQGYTKCRPDFLEVLAGALFIGGVDPNDRTSYACFDDLKEFWQAIRSLPMEDFFEKIADLASKKHFQTLWILQGKGELEPLESVLASRRIEGDNKRAPAKSKAQGRVMNILCRWQNEKFSIDRLLPNITKGKKPYEKTQFLQDVLKMVLMGLPIDYDKKDQTVMLLSHKQDIPLDSEASLLTLTYKCLRAYGLLSLDELTYYACKAGLCVQGKVSVVKDSLRIYQRFLGVTGLIDHDRLPGPSNILARQNQLWTQMIAGKTLQEIGQQTRGNDFSTFLSMFKLMGSDEYKDFEAFLVENCREEYDAKIKWYSEDREETPEESACVTSVDDDDRPLKRQKIECYPGKKMPGSEK